MYVFLTPSKTDGRVPSQQGVPTTCNLTYWEVSQQTYLQALLAGLSEATGQNSDLQGGVEGGIETWVWPKGEFIPSGGGEVSCKKTHARFSTHQIPTDTHSYIFPSNTFHLWTYHFFQTPIQQKTGLKNRYFLETDLLGAPDACYGCKKFWNTF